jgi:hypothetical protein
MSFETDIFPGETHLHAAGLDAPSAMRPPHIFWSERLPWVQPDDGLRRHAKGLQDGAARGETIVERRRQPDGRA